MRVYFVALMFILILGRVPAEEMSIDIEIRPEFISQLTRDSDLMTLGGAKIIDMGTNRYMVVAVGWSSLTNSQPSEYLHAVKVARIKANCNLMPLLNGEIVKSVQWLKEKMIVQDDKKQTSSESGTQLVEMFRSRMSGLSLPKVGHWRSADGYLYFLALGTIIELE